MVAVRRLPASEFPALANVAEGIVPHPAKVTAIVAEENGEIVGRMLLMNVAHIEGTWVRPSHRNGTVGWRLFRKAEQEAAASGLGYLYAFVADSALEDYMTRLGFTKQPFTVWLKEPICR